MSLVSLLGKNKADVLCGGRHQLYKKTLDRLFAKLSQDAELVFFLDGSIKDTKFNTWSERQNRKYQNDLKILNDVYSGVALMNLAKRFNVYNNTNLSAIEASCKQFGQLNYSVTKECDQEIAQFAYSNSRVLAVFSNDSDFLIFPGDWRYWSTKDLNITCLTTKEFNRQALKLKLKLSYYQLSVFATIAGNDIVQNQDLRRFHSDFGQKLENLFPALAKYIRKNILNVETFSNFLHFLSRDIYGTTSAGNLQRLQDSINSYQCIVGKQIHDDSPISTHLLNHNLFTYNILNGSPINFSLVYFDLRCKNMPNYYNLAVPMCQRQAGIVLFHSELQEKFVKIYTKRFHQEQYHEERVAPISPPFDVPLLDDLYSDDPQFNEDRFNLLKWTMNWRSELKDFPVHLFPENYMIDVLTLAYLRHNGVINDKEADVFLWTIKNVELNLIPKNIQPPEVPSPRAFRLAFLYVRMFANVARSIEVCGLKKRYWVS